MDQEIVDQLTLDSIPYYEEQLYGALQVIIDLQQKVEQQEMILDDDNSNENQAEDVEADLQEIISTIQFQQLKELQDIDEISQKQQEDFDQLFKQLHELEQMTNQYQQENNQDEQHIKITQQMIFERQQQLKELSQQFMMQDIHNQENQRVIQNLQQKLQLDTIIMPQHGSNEQTIEVNQIVKHQRQESEEDVDYIQYLQLTDYKQKLEEELEQIANQPKVLKEMIEVSTQTHEQEFAIRKTNTMTLLTLSVVFSLLIRWKILQKQAKYYCILFQKRRNKNRGCCSDCRIY